MIQQDQQHDLQQNEHGGYTCTRCSLTWKQQPDGTCPGAKVYQYRAIPWETLATATQLKQRKLKAVEPPTGCYFRLKDKQYIYLYEIAKAQPRRIPTEKQRETIVKMQAGLKRAYTCERCGWYDDTHGQQRRYRGRGISIIKEGEPGLEQERRYCDDCREYLIWVYDRHVTEHNMRVLLESQKEPPFLVIDTETVGLPDHPAFQVVEIAAVDKAGDVIFHSLVKPDIPMPEAASQINGLTDVDLVNAPSFAQLWPMLEEILASYQLWTYNAEFDRDAILASAERYHLEVPSRIKSPKRWNCLMLEFARYYGDYSEYWHSDRWQDLSTACYELKVEASGHHRATGDALAALGVMRALAERGGTYPAPEARPIRGGYSYGDYGD
ncbi:hypothetical protein KDA_76940 [Dictyobacter alpinus]|uniref:Exonuclease domain-containing protein n=1 Tax=Dictyobacter alpinus TaxID=2014873 RepID=A0A402BLM6_9CHLR|nr:3'-5' exonuclease [Dictyobacter alpinus]GCE32210.1 hypothetical protein KDA_76940 [Dictyobacter alpinus]